MCCDSKDFVPSCLWSISQKYFSALSLLYATMKEHDNLMDANNRIEGIEFEISVSIGMQYTTYDLNYEFWDYI